MIIKKNIYELMGIACYNTEKVLYKFGNRYRIGFTTYKLLLILIVCTLPLILPHTTHWSHPLPAPQ